jgi:hypothetical protein
MLSEQKERSPWIYIVPGILVLVAVVGYAVYGFSRSQTLETQLSATKLKLETAQTTLTAKETELGAMKKDMALLTSTGQAAAILAPERGTTASGLAFVNGDEQALRIYAYDLPAAPTGKEYQVWTVKGQEAKLLGKLDRIEPGTAYALFRDVASDGGTLTITLETAGSKEAAPKGSKVMTAGLPQPNEKGVITARARRG